MSKKKQPQDEQATEALEETHAANEDAVEAAPGEGSTPDGASRFGSKNFKIAAAGVAAAVVAGALFLAPGDRLIGIESSSAGIERNHEGDGRHGEYKDHGEYKEHGEYEDHGRGEYQEGREESGYHDSDDDGPDEEYGDHDGYGDDQDGPDGDDGEDERPSAGKDRSSEGSSTYPSAPSDAAPLGTSQS